MSDVVNGSFFKKSPNNVLIDKLNKISEIERIVIVTEYSNGDMEMNFSDMTVKDLAWFKFYMDQIVTESITISVAPDRGES